MRQSLLIFAVLIVHVYSAPQFVTFNDGKLGVNFGGYHAGVGLGGLLGGGAGAGGLFAEAGTPFGQSAKAGLGGSINGNGRNAGGLYAGATAGGNVKAEAGLGGEVAAAKTAGVGFASSSAAGSHASSGLGGETSFSGSSGFSYSAKSFGTPTVVKETEVVVTPVEVHEEKKVYKEVNLQATNEIIPDAGVDANAEVNINVNAKANDQPTVIVKEIYVEPPPPKVIEKHIIHTYKPLRHHSHKTAYVGGFIGGGANLAPSTIHVQPVIERRVDVDSVGTVNAGAEAHVGTHNVGAGGVTYTKKVSVASNPGFFQDIFNIPISTLKAVGSLLSNVAGNTKVSVEKTASVQASAGASASAGAESDLISPKHASPSSASESHISVQTPSVSKVIDDIFSIPINTLTAVNKFLGNNIVGRKRVQVSQDGAGEPTQVRLGPHARRRANKQIVLVQESNTETKQD